MKKELFKNQLIEHTQYIIGGGDTPNDGGGGSKKRKKSFWQWLKGLFT